MEPAAAATGGVDADDEHNWLEEVASDSNLEWVRAQNNVTLERLGNPEESPLYNRVLAILDRYAHASQSVCTSQLLN